LIAVASVGFSSLRNCNDFCGIRQISNKRLIRKRYCGRKDLGTGKNRKIKSDTNEE